MTNCVAAIIRSLIGLVPTRRRLLLAGVAVTAWLSIVPAVRADDAAALQWFKGNTHVHSRWSDGRDMPDMVADWYKSQGYQFLVVTDHNVIQRGVKWADVGSTPELADKFEAFRAKFPAVKVATREGEDPKTGKTAPQARVRPLAEYRGLFEEPGKFLLIMGEEISDACPVMIKGKKVYIQIHLNAWNLAAPVPPQRGASVHETIANNVAAVAKQEAKQKQPTVTVLNHPNWGYKTPVPVPVEDFASVADLRFFEVLNGHVGDLETTGDATRLSTDRLWDVVLVVRLVRLGLPPIYGVAGDDSHSAGKGGAAWIVVRAASLTADALVTAVRAGDFYATNGLRLKDVQRDGNEYVVQVDPEEGITYTIQFIGTLRGYDRNKEDAKDAQGALLPPTERYSPEIGQVLKEVKGTQATYTPTGQELYVRAKIVSSKPPATPDSKDTPETAWTQPMIVGQWRKRAASGRRDRDDPVALHRVSFSSICPECVQ